MSRRLVEKLFILSFSYSCVDLKGRRPCHVVFLEREQQKLPVVVAVAQFPPTTLVPLILYLFIYFSFIHADVLAPLQFTIGNFVATNTHTHTPRPQK